jgi:hypothetical protein
VTKPEREATCPAMLSFEVEAKADGEAAFLAGIKAIAGRL